MIQRSPEKVDDLRQRLFTDSIHVTLTESEEDGLTVAVVFETGEIPRGSKWS